MKNLYKIAAIITSLSLLYFYPVMGLMYILGALTISIDYYKEVQKNKELIEKITYLKESNDKLGKEIQEILIQIEIIENGKSKLEKPNKGV